MVVTLNGFTIQKSPRDQTLISYPVIVEVPAGTTRTIESFTEFNGALRSVQIINQDGANNGTARIHSVTSPVFNLPASGAVGFNDQWINMIILTAGAAGSLIVQAEVVPQNGVAN